MGTQGVIYFIAIVAVWDGLGIIPCRYSELLVAINYSKTKDYMLIMSLGRAFSGIFTYKIANSVLRKGELEEIYFTHSSSYCMHRIKKYMKRHPLIMGIGFRLFFPS